MVKVGILGIQGCLLPHKAMLDKLGVENTLITDQKGIEESSHLILPGGESSTMLKLLESSELFNTLKDHIQIKPTLGFCAGSILLAKKVTNPEQRSLNIMNIIAHRNFYGSQLDSFKAKIKDSFSENEHAVDFIRAPKLEKTATTVKILAEYKGDSVLLQEGNKIACSFHTELGSDPWLHSYFVSL